MAIHDAIENEIQALEQQIASLEASLRQLPSGSLVRRKVKGHAYYYLVHREDGKVVTKYKGNMKSEDVLRYTNVKAEREHCRQGIKKAQKGIRLLQRVLRELETEQADSSSIHHRESPVFADAFWSRSVREKEVDLAGKPASRSGKFVKRKPPMIALYGGFDRDPFIDIARDWGWDLVDLEITREAVPADPAPVGAIVANLPTHPVVQKLRKIGCPIVRLGRQPHPDDAGFAVLLLDDAAAGRAAAVHFADRGFRSMGFVGWDPANREAFVYPMFMEFKRTAESYGASVSLKALRSSRYVRSGDGAEKYEQQVRDIADWLTAIPKPVGVLGFSDFMAAKLYAACQLAGFSVPEEVALLGVGNDRRICELSPVPLSSIDCGYDSRARVAMESLQRMLHGASAPSAPIMIRPNGVVQRRSTDLLAVRDPVVAAALRFMWDHFEQNLSVTNIAEEVGVHRRSLERAFLHHLGRSVNAELRRKRLDCCRSLLVTTSLPIADIAPQCGFASAAYLGSVFREAFGTTPHKWRTAAST